ncbi:MAG: hydrogenase maturation protease, partial [Nocardioides sp.]
PPIGGFGRVLVAGVGNVFLSDDGFGSEVARRLATMPLPPGVVVTDYGIRGMHLAYDLLDGAAALVLVDALPGDADPGTITVLEVGTEDLGQEDFDAHGMEPVAVLASLGSLGGTLPPTYVVGCRPENLDEGIGLSAVVADAVPAAMQTVTELVQRLAAVPATPIGRS